MKIFVAAFIFVAFLFVPAVHSTELVSVSYWVLEGEVSNVNCSDNLISGFDDQGNPWQFLRETCSFFFHHTPEVGTAPPLLPVCALDTCLFGKCPLLHSGETAGPVEFCQEIEDETKIVFDGWFYGHLAFVLRARQ